MKKITGLVLVLLLPLVMATGAGGLELEVFTNKDAWSARFLDENGVYYFQTEDFNDKQLLEGVSFTTVKGSISPQGYWHDTLNSWSSNPSLTTWTFTSQSGSGTYAFGGDWRLGGPGGSGNILVVTVEELGLTRYISSRYYNDFWGFVSDSPFSQVKLTGGTWQHQQIYFLDDMVFSWEKPLPATVSMLGATPQAVVTPLPGALWLVGSVLLAFLGLRRLQSGQS